MANERHVFKKLIDIDYQTLVPPKFRLEKSSKQPLVSNGNQFAWKGNCILHS